MILSTVHTTNPSRTPCPSHLISNLTHHHHHHHQQQQQHKSEDKKVLSATRADYMDYSTSGAAAAESVQTLMKGELWSCV